MKTQNTPQLDCTHTRLELFSVKFHAYIWNNKNAVRIRPIPKIDHKFEMIFLNEYYSSFSLNLSELQSQSLLCGVWICDVLTILIQNNTYKFEENNDMNRCKLFNRPSVYVSLSSLSVKMCCWRYWLWMKLTSNSWNFCSCVVSKVIAMAIYECDWYQRHRWMPANPHSKSYGMLFISYKWSHEYSNVQPL